MAVKNRKTGIGILGEVPWGTHLCQFYKNKEDLLDILVPYFKAGLENGEFCMWITSEPLLKEDAHQALRRAIPDFDEKYFKKGQIEILSHDEWYLIEGRFDLRRVLNAWINKLNWALSKKYEGLRVTGNTAWLEKKDWKSFKEYEELINTTIGNYKMMALCSYALDKCGAREVIEVVGNHRYALIRQAGKWQLIENSERKKLEEIILSLSRFPAENPNPVLRINEEGKILYKNRAVDEILRKAGFKKHEVFRLLPKNFSQLAKKTLQAKKQLSDIDVRVGNKIYSYTLSPIKEARYVNWYGADVTERKKAQEILKRDKLTLQKAVGEKGKQLTEAQRDLKEAQRLSDIGMLAATIAHELRNPLGVIKVAAYNIGKKQKGASINKHLINIDKKIKESDQIIKNLLSYSHITIPKYERINCAKLISGCLENIKHKYKNWEVKVKRSCSCTNEDFFEADKLQMIELFSNVIDNAYQAFPGKKGIIEVMGEYDRKRNIFEIIVEDNGIGMKAEDLKKAFNPFFTTRTKGIGLGLTVCRQIVNLHKGAIDVKSKEQKGTKVIIKLPIKREAKFKTGGEFDEAGKKREKVSV